MTTYRLRDKERQAALEKALPGFGQILQDKCEKFFDNSNAIRVCNADDGWEIYISKTDIKAVDDYNPYTWNSFPEVEPPDGVLMRVERSDGAKRCAYFHNFSDGGCWCYYLMGWRGQKHTVTKSSDSDRGMIARMPKSKKPRKKGKRVTGRWSHDITVH